MSDITLNIYESISLDEYLARPGGLSPYANEAEVGGVTIRLQIFKVNPRKRIFERDKESYNKRWEEVTR